MSYDRLRITKKKFPEPAPQPPVEIPNELETEIDGQRQVDPEATTELIISRDENDNDNAVVIEDDNNTEARTERIETRHAITEMAHALTYAIHSRLNHLEKQRENATLWWKMLDRVFRTAGTEQAKLQQTLQEVQTILTSAQHPAVQEATLQRLRAVQQELVQSGNVPEILAAPQENYTGTPVIHTEYVGGMKPGHRKERGPEKFGEYGQDGKRINEASGTTVVFDGAELYPDSYAVGEMIATKVEEILHGLPDTKDTSLIEKYINERYPEIAASLENLQPADMLGAAAFSATRFLPRAELLVAIKVGDGEIILQRKNGDTRELLANDPKGKKGVTTVGIIESAHTRTTISPELRMIITPAQKGDKVHTTTDGVINNTKQKLLDWARKGKIGDLMRSIKATKDDVIVVTQEL